MKIIEYFGTKNKAHWLAEIKKSEWAAGQLLHQLITGVPLSYKKIAFQK